MKRVTNIFVKHFSQIGNIQQKKDVFYNLVESEDLRGTWYGVELVEFYEGKRESDVRRNLSRQKSNAMAFLTLLYENAIVLDCWRVYIDDFLSDCQLPEQEESMVQYG